MTRNGISRRVREGLPLVPFFVLVFCFLLIPTITIVLSSVFENGSFTLDRIHALFTATALTALGKSVLLSGSTAIIGAFLGAVLAYLIVSRPPESFLRRTVISLSSVL